MKYPADDRSFAFFDFQVLLDALAAFLDFYGAISERRFAAVPKPLSSIFQHSADHMLGCFLAVQRIGGGKNGLRKIGRRAFTEVLRHGDERDPVFLQLALGNDISRSVTEEPGLAVNQKHVEW